MLGFRSDSEVADSEFQSFLFIQLIVFRILQKNSIFLRIMRKNYKQDQQETYKFGINDFENPKNHNKFLQYELHLNLREYSFFLRILRKNSHEQKT